MDFRWDQVFSTDKYDYLERRLKLQQELEQFTPIPQDDLEKAADMLANFPNTGTLAGVTSTSSTNSFS